MDKAYTIGKMEIDTWVNGKMINNMVKDLKYGLISRNTKVNTKRVQKMEKAV